MNTSTTTELLKNEEKEGTILEPEKPTDDGVQNLIKNEINNSEIPMTSSETTIEHLRKKVNTQDPIEKNLSKDPMTPSSPGNETMIDTEQVPKLLTDLNPMTSPNQNRPVIENFNKKDFNQIDLKPMTSHNESNIVNVEEKVFNQTEPNPVTSHNERVTPNLVKNVFNQTRRRPHPNQTRRRNNGIVNKRKENQIKKINFIQSNANGTKSLNNGQRKVSNGTLQQQKRKPKVEAMEDEEQNLLNFVIAQLASIHLGANITYNDTDFNDLIILEDIQHLLPKSEQNETKSPEMMEKEMKMKKEILEYVRKKRLLVHQLPERPKFPGDPIIDYYNSNPNYYDASSFLPGQVPYQENYNQEPAQEYIYNQEYYQEPGNQYIPSYDTAADLPIYDLLPQEEPVGLYYSDLDKIKANQDQEKKGAKEPVVETHSLPPRPVSKQLPPLEPVFYDADPYAPVQYDNVQYDYQDYTNYGVEPNVYNSNPDVYNYGTSGFTPDGQPIIPQQYISAYDNQEIPIDPNQQQYFASSTQPPITDQQYYVSSTQAPSYDQQYYVSSTQLPISDQQYYVSSTQPPIADQQYFVSSTQPTVEISPQPYYQSSTQQPQQYYASTTQPTILGDPQQYYVSSTQPPLNRIMSALRNHQF